MNPDFGSNSCRWWNIHCEKHAAVAAYLPALPPVGHLWILWYVQQEIPEAFYFEAPLSVSSCLGSPGQLNHSIPSNISKEHHLPCLLRSQGESCSIVRRGSISMHVLPCFTTGPISQCASESFPNALDVDWVSNGFVVTRSNRGLSCPKAASKCPMSGLQRVQVWGTPYLLSCRPA